MINFFKKIRLFLIIPLFLLVPFSAEAFSFQSFQQVLQNFWDNLFSGQETQTTGNNDFQLNLDHDITLNLWTTEEGEDVFSWPITLFENQNPEIKVEIKTFASEESLYKALKAGDLPDIFMISDYWLPEFYDQISPAPTGLIAISDLEENFVPLAREAFATETKIWAMPLYVRSLAMFYNPSLLRNDQVVLGDKPPANWPDFLSSKSAYQELANKKSAFVGVSAFDNSDYTLDLFQAFLLQAGAERPLTKSSDANDAFVFLSMLTDAFFNNQQSEFKAFTDNKVAVVFGDERFYKELKTSGFADYETTQIPQLDEKNPLTKGEIWGFAISSSASDVNSAWVLAHYLANKENAQDFFTKTNKTLAIKTDNTDFFTQNAQIAKSTRDFYNIDLIDTFRDDLKNYIQEKITAEKALQDFDNILNNSL